MTAVLFMLIIICVAAVLIFIGIAFPRVVAVLCRTVPRVLIICIEDVECFVPSTSVGDVGARPQT